MFQLVIGQLSCHRHDRRFTLHQDLNDLVQADVIVEQCVTINQLQ